MSREKHTALPTTIANRDIESAATQKQTTIRSVLDACAWFACHDHRLQLLQNGIVIAHLTGIQSMWVHLLRRIYNVELNQEAAREALFSIEELQRQREATPQAILVSIVVPVYNTPELFLREMIQSVLDQTYASWELCIADGSDPNNHETERICREYAHNDQRIRYQRLEQNLGISGNTNECLAMAAGKYVTLLDHDDILHPAALYETVRVICSTGADFVYTDECTFVHAPGDVPRPHFKPAFAPHALSANNYICHLSTFSRDLLNRVGGFCSECDGSQDFDMIMRLTEQAKRVVHLPEVLYYWRAHEDSVALSINAKPYAIQAGKRAVERRLERTGWAGSVEAVSDDVAIYRVRYALVRAPKISILMPVWGDRRAHWKSLRSVLRRTTYKDFEVIVLDCGDKSHGLQRGRRNMYGHDVHVVHLTYDTTYAEALRFGTLCCTGDYLITLAADLTVQTPDWIQELLMFAQQPNVGAVGGKVVSATGAIRQAGTCLGVAEPAASFFRGIVDRNDTGYMGRLAYAQDVSAVSSEFMMVRREVWDTLGGIDSMFGTALGDTDLCMRMRARGLAVVWTPFAQARGLLEPIPNLYGRNAIALPSLRSRREVARDYARFRKRWEQELRAGDPYYSPNFIRDRQDFTVLPVTWQQEAR